MAADPTSTVAATGLLQNAADLKAFQRRLRHDGAAGAIQGAYLHGAQRHTPLGDIHGRHNLIAADLRDLAVFDGQRLAQDAAHAGATGASRQQMAWRAEISATHAGTSTLGPASGRELRFRALSVHLLTRGRVYREWQLRDHLAIANQLGLELHAIAHEMAAAERPVPRFLPDFGEIRHGLGQKPPPAEGIDVDGADDIARDIVRQLNLAWNHRRMDQLDSLYAPDAHCHAPGARELQGVAAIRYLWTSLLACMSDAQVFFLHAVGDAEGSEHTRQVALVWRMIGRHDGPGLTHEPSGVRLQVLGISQFLLRAGRIVEEWTLFDELALLKQIFVAQRQTRQ